MRAGGAGWEAGLTCGSRAAAGPAHPPEVASGGCGAGAACGQAPVWGLWESPRPSCGA